MTKATIKLLTGAVGVAASVALLGGSTMAWFTNTKTIPASPFTAGTVQISAGQKVVTDSGCGKQYYEEIKPASAKYIKIGKGINAQSRRANPNNVLSLSNGTASDDDMCSLGLGGSILVTLGGTLNKGDVLVIEDTWDGSQPNYVETAEVYVSSNGTDFTDAGTISNQTNPKGNFHDCTVSCPIEGAQYIKLIDTTPKDSKSSDGFDVDYLCGRNIIDETNWNPGDTNKIAFYVNNVGTKDIQLRVKLDQAWSEVTDPNSGDVVTIEPDDQWTDGHDGWYYYKGVLSGIQGGETPTTQGLTTSADLNLNVTLSGPDTGNAYQDKTFTITPMFEAIQNSHSDKTEADGWDWGSFDSYNPGK